MRSPGQPDCLLVVNGPEDGAEFAITRAPVYVGSDPSCAVVLGLDNAVHGCHARLTVVSDGYRVRGIGGARTLVNGTRVGTVRSRILRSGGHLQVGETVLLLETSPDGLASRSRGIVTESDWVWALSRAGETAGHLAGYLGWGLKELARGILGHWKMSALIGIAALLLLYPTFRAWAVYLVQSGIYQVRLLLSR